MIWSLNVIIQISKIQINDLVAKRDQHSYDNKVRYSIFECLRFYNCHHLNSDDRPIGI